MVSEMNISITGFEKAQAALESLTKAAKDCDAALRELGINISTDTLVRDDVISCKE